MKYQIIYAADRVDPEKVHPYFVEEEAAMRAIGIPTALKPSSEAEYLILRSTTIASPERYPQDPRFIHNYDINARYLFMENYYDCIKGLTMETFFADRLDDSVVSEIKWRGWDRAFIKGDVFALEHIEPGLSVWPNHTFEEMMVHYANMGVRKYAIREYYDSEKLERDYHRFWVINGKIYRNDNVIPDIVIEAVRRLNVLGGKYYTVDATPDIVMEVNPGESSDRHGENSAALFASWFKDAFEI